MFKKTVTVVINNCEGDRLEKKNHFLCSEVVYSLMLYCR